MENTLKIIQIISSAITLIGLVVAVIISIHKVFVGQRCILRSNMLDIYYKYQAEGIIRQYDYENFVMLYEAYKKLHGNSFIDKIYKEVQTWKVVT